MKKILLPLILISGLNAYAQIDRQIGFEEFDYNADGGILSINGDYRLNATSLSNKLISSDFITSELKDLNSDKHNETNNRIGLDLEFGVTYQQKKEQFLGIDNAGYFIGIRSRDHIDMVYRKQLFDLLMYGNSPYLGTSMNIGDLSANRFKYEQIQVGFLKSKSNDDRTITGGLGISFVKGTSGLNLILNEGVNFYTSEQGEYIDFDMDGSLSYTDQTKASLGDLNGIGFSSDLHFNIDYSNGNNINLKVTDLGVIKWDETSSNYSNKESFHFEGISMDDILSYSDSIFSGISQDSIQQEILGPESNSSFTSALPTRIQLEGTKAFKDEQLFTKLGVLHQLNSNFAPYYYLKLRYKLGDQFITGVKMAYGGYGRFNAGIEVSTTIVKNTMIVLGSSNVDALILPNSSNGQSYYLSLQRLF